MIMHRLQWLLPVVLLAGCGAHDMSDLQAYVNKINARPPGPIEPLPEIQPPETFVYEPAERRDPFQSDAKSAPEDIAAVDSGPAPDPNRPKEELESYPLDALRMVGTLEQYEARWGLVRTRDGIVHRVAVGNYMGQNHGQIISIGLDAIQLNELVSEAPGQWRERLATVALTQ